MHKTVSVIIVLIYLLLSLNEVYTADREAGRLETSDPKYKRDTMELGDSTFQDTLYGNFELCYLTFWGDDTNSVNPDTFKAYNRNHAGDYSVLGLKDNMGNVDTLIIIDSNQVKRYMVYDARLWIIYVVRLNGEDLDNRVSIVNFEKFSKHSSGGKPGGFSGMSKIRKMPGYDL